MQVQAYKEAFSSEMNRIQRKYNNEESELLDVFRYFVPGRYVYIPNEYTGGGGGRTYGMVLGYKFGTNKKNLFAPSNITLQMAIGSSRKSLSLPLSGSNLKTIFAIKGATGYNDYPLDYCLNMYQRSIKEAEKDRNTRFIVTGNMLLFFGSSFKYHYCPNLTMRT